MKQKHITNPFTGMGVKAVADFCESLKSATFRLTRTTQNVYLMIVECGSVVQKALVTKLYQEWKVFDER